MDSSSNRTSAVLIIGNEVLSGRTKDANLNFIATKLSDVGITLVEARVVRDVEEEIIAALNALRTPYDYVFTTGGIGTTHDDITAGAVATEFGRDLVQNDEAIALLESRYQDELTESARKMAILPEGSTLIQNPVTIAPGFQVDNVFVLAGVPAIAQAMFDDVLSKITHGKPILSETVTCRLPESYVATPLEELQKQHTSLDIGSYPRWTSSGFDLNLVVRGVAKEEVLRARADLERLVKKLTREFEQVHVLQR